MVKFDTLLTGADYQSASGLRMQPKAISGCAGGSVGLLAFLDGVRCALSRRAQTLVSSSDRRVASQSQVDDKFADNFVPYRRVISCDSDLDSLHLLAPSVSGSSVSPRSVSRVSLCCGACVGDFGARCGVSSEHVSDCVNSEGDHSDHHSWKHGPEAFGGTKALKQGSGNMDGRSFADTVLGGAALEQYSRGAPEGTKVEAWEGRIFTCSRPTTWDVSVAEGCIVSVSAVYLPKKRPDLPAAEPLRGILFGWSRGCFTLLLRGYGSFEVLHGDRRFCLRLHLVLTGQLGALTAQLGRCSRVVTVRTRMGRPRRTVSFFEVCGGQSHP